MGKYETKLEWYFSTKDPDEYKLYQTQFESLADFYSSKGYDFELELGDGWLRLEVMDFYTKNDVNQIS